MHGDPSPSSSTASSSSSLLRPRNINRPGTWFKPKVGHTKLATTAEDFVMISPIKAHQAMPPTPARLQGDTSSSSPEDSPTPACGVASATARLKLVDDDSPSRRIQHEQGVFLSTGLKGRESPTSPLKYSTLFPNPQDEDSPQLPPTPLMSNAPLPQPLFPPLRTSQSQDCDATKSGSDAKASSHRARSSTDAQRPLLGQKKAISLDALHKTAEDKNEPFGHHPQPSFLGKKSRPPSAGSTSVHRAHKRHNSGDHHGLGSISRSTGQKSGLALTLTPANSTEFASSSSLSSTSSFSPAEPPIFEDVKPLAEAFENSAGTLLRKFKPRDSGVAMDDPSPLLRVAPPAKPPPLTRPKRPAMLKRTSSMGDERVSCQTPSITGPSMASGWPTPNAFGFLGETAKNLSFKGDQKPSMPDTPVKRNAYGHMRTGSRGSSLGGLPIAKASSQPTIEITTDMTGTSVDTKPLLKTPVPAVTLTITSSPETPMEVDVSSPTVRLGPQGLPPHASHDPSPSKVAGRMDLLRVHAGGSSSDCSEDEGTPTKGGASERPRNLGVTPGPSPSPTPSKPPAGIMPRMSLPAFAAPKQHKTLHHRQSHPAPNIQVEEDLFEARFITLDTLGKGAFSTVLKVQERIGDGLYAVKKARGVFDGVKDRLRHLEEVDILRHLSKSPCPHVIKFEDAWEQNRQLFIQTELCLGSLAFFLEEYGRVVERLDEGRVWKIVRELSDGINHIHSSGVIHFDIKPANILISSTGSLKIGDFGLATRWPRISADEILKGSGLGGTAAAFGPKNQEKLEREGDRVYMPPEMLRGVFVQEADIFSFGLVILEVSTNICVPDGGAAWQALRTNDFTVVDLSPLSPALTDLIVSCMQAEPKARPLISQIVSHPIVQRARTGKDALAPEDPRWLVDILSGGSSLGFAPRPMASTPIDGDVDMID
ncbi:kinase-like domain-containing protein [Kockovaella imperatae]|uniref:Kinase-like domain-containing protein n=1 Tax=Kockovaella imperatae TaxID=4999 RepID=A0A1Y1USS8_9TREE|nr:kinase-like domain-containing protein [Kockovaella imperatae]ORX40486.1 kinase-like domain-containing protein [Kockovaella imperatae]